MVLRGRPRGRVGHRRNTLFKGADLQVSPLSVFMLHYSLRVVGARIGRRHAPARSLLKKRAPKRGCAPTAATRTPLSRKVKTKSCRISELTRLPLGALIPEKAPRSPAPPGPLGGWRDALWLLGRWTFLWSSGESGCGAGSCPSPLLWRVVGLWGRWGSRVWCGTG